MTSSSPVVLVTGASGLLGRPAIDLLRQRLEGSPVRVMGTGFSRAAGDIIKLDLTDEAAVFDTLTNVIKPMVVVHLAAERRPDQAADFVELNVRATHALARACAALGAWLIYVSTDYVFSGEAAPYDETARPDPINRYGESKAAGEAVVVELLPATHTILRVPILYGPVEFLAESAVSVLAQQMLTAAAAPDAGDRVRVRVEDWATRYPTFTCDVAVILCEIVLRVLRGEGDDRACVAGVLHWSGIEARTKFQMAEIMLPMIADALGATVVLASDSAAPSGEPRPQNSQLRCSRLEAVLAREDSFSPGFMRTPFARGILLVFVSLGLADLPE